VRVCGPADRVGTPVGPNNHQRSSNDQFSGGDRAGHRHQGPGLRLRLIWFTEQCLSNVLRLETYIQDAERDGDNELANFFRRAQSESRKGVEQGKEQLRKRLSA